jgi:hypothetical protein
VLINDPHSDSILNVAKKGGFKLNDRRWSHKVKNGVIDVNELTRVIAIKE